MNIKKAIAICLILAFVSTFGGYLGKSFFKGNNSINLPQIGDLSFNSDQKTEQNSNNTSYFDTSAEVSKINTLIRSYLIASLNFDWDTILSISSGNYKKEVKETIIPNAQKLQEENKIEYNFNSRNMEINYISLTENEAVVNVIYVIDKGIDGHFYKSQEEIKLMLAKEDGIWKILSVDTIY